VSVVTIVDYGVGNLASVSNMIRKVGGEARLVDQPEQVEDAEKLLFPGVGAWDAAMSAVHERGFAEPLRSFAASGRPLLGICLGMQLLFERSEEGSLPGLGLLSGQVSRFDDQALRVPHMGWNTVRPLPSARLFATDEGSLRFYFAHSYRVEPKDTADIAAVANYGSDFACAVQKGNLLGTQFHPEKSHRFGMSLFSRFLEL
jgi:imidazole glycerol-phosphate synthase subunit HisH